MVIVINVGSRGLPSRKTLHYNYILFDSGSPVDARFYALLCTLLRCMTLYSILLLYS